MKNDSVSRCRKCNKVIVGSPKLGGLCESCFSQEATKGGVLVTLGGIAYKYRKQIANAFKKLTELFKR